MWDYSPRATPVYASEAELHLLWGIARQVNSLTMTMEPAPGLQGVSKVLSMVFFFLVSELGIGVLVIFPAVSPSILLSSRHLSHL